METAATDNNKTAIDKKKWFDDECTRELRKRNKLRLEMLTEEQEEPKIGYGQQRKITKKLLREKEKGGIIKRYQKKQRKTVKTKK